jgi:methanogenic corrinoid protein MtbC1
VLIDGVVAPLLEQIGERWSHGRLRPAHEHLASAIVVRILGEVIEGAEPSAPGPSLVVATPPGQLHEFGALFVAVTAVSEEWRVTYLGRDLPGADIAAAANETDADAVALSIVFTATPATELERELVALRNGLSAKLPIFAGGAAAASYSAALEAIDAERLEDLDELRIALRGLS